MRYGMPPPGVLRCALAVVLPSGAAVEVGELLELAKGGLTPATQVALKGCSDVHTLASALRAWLREQPALIPPTSYAEFEKLASLGVEHPAIIAAAEGCVAGLPESGSQATLRALLGFLQRVDGKVTKMTSDNLGMVFAPTLLNRTGEVKRTWHVPMPLQLA